MFPNVETRRQLLRYAITGLASNALLYAGYLLLTSGGFGHKASMTVMYCAGIAGTFIFNRRWTFAHGGAFPPALLRYLATNALGYVFVLLALLILVDAAGLPHRWVMAVLIVVSAGLTFLAQKYWIFRVAATAAPG